MLIESVGRMIVQAHSNKHQFAWVNKKKTPKRIVCISQHIHTLRGMASETVEFFCRGGRFIFSMIDFMSQHNRNKNNNTYNNNHSLAGQSDTMRKKNSDWALTTLGERWSNTSSTSNYNNSIIWNPNQKNSASFTIVISQKYKQV